MGYCLIIVSLSYYLINLKCAPTAFITQFYTIVVAS